MWLYINVSIQIVLFVEGVWLIFYASLINEAGGDNDHHGDYLAAMRMWYGGKWYNLFLLSPGTIKDTTKTAGFTPAVLEYMEVTFWINIFLVVVLWFGIFLLIASIILTVLLTQNKLHRWFLFTMSGVIATFLLMWPIWYLLTRISA